MKILIAGDYYPRRRIAKLLVENDYSFFDEIIPITNDCDYSIVNFEGCVASDSDTPIDKTGPNLKCEENAINSIKYAGFDCVTLANNHFRDYGDSGVWKTLECCKKEGIDSVGGGINLDEAKNVLYKTIDGKTIAIINRCESEWSIATKVRGGAAPINPINDYYMIKEASNKADYVLMIIHGGIEEYPYPTPRMKQLYRFYIDAGADAIINHHQHCISGYEFYCNKPIFYGLGNFCFDWVTGPAKWWEEEFMVMIDFGPAKIEFQLYPYLQFSDLPKVAIIKDRSSFDDEIQKLNQVISSDVLLEAKFLEWTSKRNNISLLEPYNNKITMGLFARRLLPSFLNDSKKRQILNLVRCESHLESLIQSLSNELIK